MDWRPPTPENVTVPEVVQVYDYNGRVGDSFRVFYLEQHPDRALGFRNPDAADSHPEPAMTNRESWDRYGVATAGEPASCEERRDEILGYVCPLESHR